MGKEKLRYDKTCLNCRYVVENRYCPNCGQENTDTRKTFHHLFFHFFEDLTHYENAFWKTIRNLLFKPSSLTKEYLSGKRLSYLAPVRLYIFISFVTFFIFAILPDSDLKDKDEVVLTDTIIKTKVTSPATDSIPTAKDTITPAMRQIDQMVKAGVFPKTDAEEFKQKMRESIEKQKNNDFDFGYKTIAELDSVKKFGKGDDELSDWEYNAFKRIIEIREHNTKEEIIEKFKESAIHNFPKVLFIYMPLFAFFLWLFHSKKKWYYFDHGIFTLHYFSFLLLISLILTLIEEFLYMFGQNMITMPLNAMFGFVGYVWMLYYFFPAHHRFYGESRIVSLIKSLGLLFINMILMSFMMVAFLIYTFLTLH